MEDLPVNKARKNAIKAIENYRIEALVWDGIPNIFTVELMYPEVGSNFKKIEVGLCDVRAADSIQIEYDFDRDGYSIKQASKFSWDADDKICDADWQEVAFIKAWGRKNEEEE